MKLRLPSRLVQALLTTCAAALTTTTPAFADIPEDYTQVVISSADDLNQYSSSSRYAFLVEADIIAATHMYGSSQYWSSVNPESQRLLTFSGISSDIGGAIDSGTLTMEEFKELLFSSCVSTTTDISYYFIRGGGAIYDGDSNRLCLISSNGAVEFSKNHAYYRGGAIFSYAEIVMDHNTSLSFDHNYVSLSDRPSSLSIPAVCGGAIYVANALEVQGNNSVSFDGNYAKLSFTESAKEHSTYGGAIYAGDSSDITLSGNKSVTFSRNYARSSNSSDDYADKSAVAHGGAIYGGGSGVITLSSNENTTFSGNYAYSYTSSYSFDPADARGGAIYGESSSIIVLSGSENVTFSGNYAYSYASSKTYTNSFSYGGAIYGGSSSVITLSGNESLVFNGNYTESSSFSLETYYSVNSNSYGGAIYGESGSNITLSNNGSVTFSGNYTNSAGSGYTVSYRSYGGAIYAETGSTITLSGNSSVAFRGNHSISSLSSTSRPRGGAIYGEDNSSICIEGNGSVEFRGNYEKYGTGSYTYRLRGLYTIGNSLKLSAGEGQSIAFYDGIYTGAKVTVSYNGKYVDSDGNEHAGTGDILMSGVHAEEDLYALKQDYTQSELDNSRLFEINGTACLYGGRLRVEEQAVYKGAGIDIVADSNAVLRVSNASLVLTDGITVGANAKITGRQSNEISTSDGIDISEPQMRGAEGMGTLSNVNVDIIDDYTIENMSISGSVIDISAGKHLYVKHVNIEADARITDEAAWLDMVDTHGWLDNSNTEASAPVMSLGDTLFYRSGDDAWMRLDHDVSYVALTSELFSNVTMIGSDLWLDLTGLADTIGSARAFSIAFKDALYDVSGLRVVATVDGEHYLDGYYTTKQEGTTTTLYFSSQIPEPTTSTLSLLALAALAARRRRK